MPPGLARHFVTIPGQRGTRQVHYRRAGSGPVILLLHQSPQSSREMEPLMAEWARDFTLIAPDTPGYGFSDPLGGEPSLQEFARATLEFADALGIGRFGIYGFHTGASIGIALAHAAPDRVAAVAANGLLMVTEEERSALLAEYLPRFEPKWDGSHLTWLWARLREQNIFFPWHERTAATRMDFDVSPPERLQFALEEFLAAGDHYADAYRAAFAFNVEPLLPGLEVPVLVTAMKRDPLAAHLARVGPRAGCVQVVPSDETSDALARLQAHLRAHPGSDAVRVPEDGAVPAWPSNEYVGEPGSQVRVRRSGAGAAHVLLIHPPGQAAALVDDLAGSLATDGAVLVPDLPGHGASDPVPADRALAETIDRLARLARPLLAIDAGPCTVIGIGASAAVALELAARIGHGTRAALIDPVRRTSPEIRRWLADGLPDDGPLWHGGHLPAAWHRVRDGRLFDPWFARNRTGIRPGEPELDVQGIHAEVRESLRANGAWQALFRALLRADLPEASGTLRAGLEGPLRVGWTPGADRARATWTPLDPVGIVLHVDLPSRPSRDYARLSPS